MRAGNFARILIVSLALGAYLACVLTLRRAAAPSQGGHPAAPGGAVADPDLPGRLE
jgi:hypothetical protein